MQIQSWVRFVKFTFCEFRLAPKFPTAQHAVWLPDQAEPSRTKPSSSRPHPHPPVHKTTNPAKRAATPYTWKPQDLPGPFRHRSFALSPARTSATVQTFQIRSSNSALSPPLWEITAFAFSSLDLPSGTFVRNDLAFPFSQANNTPLHLNAHWRISTVAHRTSRARRPSRRLRNALNSHQNSNVKDQRPTRPCSGPTAGLSHPDPKPRLK